MELTTELKQKIKEAKEIFGIGPVGLALSIVSVSDPDGAYIHLLDYGQEEAAEVVEFIYFE